MYIGNRNKITKAPYSQEKSFSVSKRRLGAPKKETEMTENLIGKKYGRLTVIKDCGLEKDCCGRNQHFVVCKCGCGKERKFLFTKLKTGRTKSCGCVQVEKFKKYLTKHGLSRTKIYDIYDCMRRRSTDKRYKYYAGRGITICDEWKNDFMSFYNWAITSGYKEGLTIDRIDVNGNYEPSNCRWATHAQQQRNRRCNVFVEINGQKKCLAEWCEFFNIGHSTIMHRLKHGWKKDSTLFKKPNYKFKSGGKKKKQ